MTPTNSTVDPEEELNKILELLQTETLSSGYTGLWKRQNLLPRFKAKAAILAYCSKQQVLARIDQIRCIKDSDVHLNYGTIELLAYMLRGLNKDKIRLASLRKGDNPTNKLLGSEEEEVNEQT